ncbi:ABC transporter substrate-binding protein [Altericista sp. CCNU0014]|uniref:ABC transporter substrate-binding protein n=1 Tax=Altericista sp. CCNU0014 TaxID=3082949 RepID=UPI00384BBCC3
MLKAILLSVRRWIVWGLVGCLLVVAVAGCQWQLKSAQARVPQLVLSSLSDPKTFNTVLSQEQSDVFPLIGEGLISENGLTGKIEPALAESWTISTDGKQVVYTLKPNLKWSDGQPLTVDDVVFTYNDVFLNKEIPTDFRDVLKIGKTGALPTVRKLDERRVEFSIPEPFAPFLRVTGAGILPKHILEKSIRTKDSNGKPHFLSVWGVNTQPLSNIVVAGPYKIESYRVGERVILRRNPYYWRRGDRGEQQPYVERIALQVVENTDTDLLQFRSGGIDVNDVTSDYFALLKREEKQRGFKIYNGGPSLRTLYLSFNLNKGRNASGKPFVDPIKSKWFNNVKFRQAIAYATNRRDMLNNIYQGLGDLQHSIIPVQSPYYLSPKAGLKTYEYDIDKAKALLAEAGFKYDANDRLVDSDGNRVRFSLITNAGNKIREAIGAQFKQDLSRLGIQVDFNPMAFNTLVDKLSRSKEWDCLLLGFAGGGIEPNQSFNIWAVNGGLHSFNQGPGPGEPPFPGREIADWEQKINDLYIQGAQELNETKRKAIYGEAQQLVQEYLPFFYLITPLSFSAVRDRVQNIKYSPLGGALWNIHELKIAEK